MKLVLASYFEPENHGPGRKIGVSPSKPPNVEVPMMFPAFAPSKKVMDTYYANRYVDPAQAGKDFEAGYLSQLEEVISDLERISKEEKKPIAELLPFKDGDTLLSWEHKGHKSYRPTLAKYLERIGYEIELQ